MSKNVSVIMPSTGRREQLLAAVEQLLKVTPCVEVVCVIEHDVDSREALATSGLPVIIIYRKGYHGPVNCLNLGAKHASGDMFVTSSDDVWYHEDWLKEALIALESIGGSGLVGLNSLKKMEKDWDDHYLVTRDYARSAFGGVIAVPRYYHYGTDIEACRHARQDGKYIFVEKAIVEHRHPLANTAERDATYRLNNRFHVVDEMTWKVRQELGWPVDYPPSF